MFDITGLTERMFVVVTLETSETLTGVIIRIDGDFLVLKEYVDFTFWGYKFVLNSFIKEVQKEEPFERIAKIVESEKMDSISSDFRFLSTLTKFSNFLGEIYKTQRVCIFHEDAEHLSLGRITKLSRESLEIEIINRNFNVNNGSFKLPIQQISMIELGSEYLRIYQVYSDCFRS